MNAGNRTVERIAEPVDKKTTYRQPKPIDIEIGKHKSESHQEGAKDTEPSHHVAAHPSRKMVGQPDQGFLLYTVQQRGLNTC